MGQRTALWRRAGDGRRRHPPYAIGARVQARPGTSLMLAAPGQVSCAIMVCDGKRTLVARGLPRRVRICKETGRRLLKLKVSKDHLGLELDIICLALVPSRDGLNSIGLRYLDM